jgi:hypothetical protein
VTGCTLRPTLTSVRVILVLIGVLLLTVACGSHGSPSGSGKLETISTSIEPFKQAFDDSAGHARLVLLLSPT